MTQCPNTEGVSERSADEGLLFIILNNKINHITIISLYAHFASYYPTWINFKDKANFAFILLDTLAPDTWDMFTNLLKSLACNDQQNEL